MAIDYQVSESAISQIKRQKLEIHEAVAKSYQLVSKKTLHKAEYEELETKLHDWFLKQRDRNCPVNGHIPRAKAKDLFKKIYPNKEEKDFLASDGWFRNYKRRHGIRFLKVCGEILSSDTSTITPFIHHLRSKMDEMKLLPSQVYNADETGLFYKILPEKTYVAACEKSAPGSKIKKERVSILLCANADASNKITPLVIGKAAKPRCFVGFNNPLDYDHSKAAWMTTHIFKNWFHGTFVKQVSINALNINI